MALTTAELAEAAKLAKHFLRGFESFSQLAKAFDEAGSAIQAKADAEASLMDLQFKLQEAREQIAKETERQAKLIRETSSAIDAAQAKAKQLVEDAVEESKKVKAKLDAAADAAVAKAKAKVEQMEAAEAEAGERVAGLRAEATQLEARVAAAKAEIAKLLGQA